MPLSPAGAYRFAPDPISKIKIQQKDLLLCFFLCLLSFSRLKQLRRWYMLFQLASMEGLCRRQSVVSWLIIAFPQPAKGAAAWDWKAQRSEIEGFGEREGFSIKPWHQDSQNVRAAQALHDGTVATAARATDLTEVATTAADPESFPAGTNIALALVDRLLSAGLR